MKIRKFIAQTARQALRDIRNELGEDAVILSNRKVGQEMEIIATTNDAIVYLTGEGVGNEMFGTQAAAESRCSNPGTRTTNTGPQSSIIASESSILVEIKSMHNMMQQQLAALSWSDIQQRDPQRAGILRRILNSGFSALLARQLLDKMPAGSMQGDLLVKQVLKCNLNVVSDEDDIIVKGGTYALIGPTGVGKTTTTAKLAARAVVRYGADKVALLTTDSYRVGAYEQLKIYGKILGVAVHAVKDTSDLCLTLSALRHKHLILIDTVGMGQRDERVSGQNEMFDQAGVERLLLLNATSSGDTLEDVVRMYHSKKVIGCVVTKLDEAANFGAVLDVTVRHRLALHYMANGQRVPEDLHKINLDYLLHRALKSAGEKTPFTLNELEFPVLMAAEGSPHTLVKRTPPDTRPVGGHGAGGVAPVLLAGAGTPSTEASYAL